MAISQEDITPPQPDDQRIRKTRGGKENLKQHDTQPKETEMEIDPTSSDQERADTPWERLKTMLKKRKKTRTEEEAKTGH
uniref:Uncharacterized protein n=1 Tax=Bracon brevicornis TaxID=1563983 RepID=A0A6V7LQS7_9HYME